MQYLVYINGEHWGGRYHLAEDIADLERLYEEYGSRVVFLWGLKNPHFGEGPVESLEAQNKERL